MDQEKMRAAMQRADRTFSKRPEAAQMKKIAKAIVREGARCEFSEDGWDFVADMPEALGGTATGPGPGTFARAALSTCLAIGYSMRFAYLGVPLRSVEVELRADQDHRGLFCGQAQVGEFHLATTARPFAHPALRRDPHELRGQRAGLLHIDFLSNRAEVNHLGITPVRG